MAEYKYQDKLFDWVIIGAQTGRNAVKPKREWIEEIINWADKRNKPVFLKNNLKGIIPEPLRQEFPNVDDFNL